MLEPVWALCMVQRHHLEGRATPPVDDAGWPQPVLTQAALIHLAHLKTILLRGDCSQVALYGALTHTEPTGALHLAVPSLTQQTTAA